jgi:hypothetical protein
VIGREFEASLLAAALGVAVVELDEPLAGIERL